MNTTKKLLVFATAAAISSFTFAGDYGTSKSPEKIDSDFDSLDNNDDAYISKEEADDNEVWQHFAVIDRDGDGRLSQGEFKTYITQNPGMVDDDVMEDEMEDAE